MTTSPHQNGGSKPARRPKKSERARWTGPPPKNLRNRLASGRDILPFVDGRSLIAKRYRQITQVILADQQGDGVSETRLQLIRRFAGAAVLAEQLEAQAVMNGLEEIDLTAYTSLISCLVRVASRIGIDRIPRTVTPSLSTYLNGEVEP